MAQISVQTVYDWLDSFAPFDTAEDFDNAGLLLGDRAVTVQKVLFALDATPEVAREAVRLGAELVVVHHPLMFGGIRRIDYTLPEGQALCTLAGNRVNLIAAHTNFDKAPGGTGDSLAQALELGGVAPVGEYIRMGTLKRPMAADELANFVQERLQSPLRRYGDGEGPITRAAVGPGACGAEADTALLAGAQAYVVGEIKHHELLDVCGRGLVVLEAGHFATEIIGLRALFQRFQTAAAKACWQVQPMLFPHIPFWGALGAPQYGQAVRGGTHGTD